MYILFTLQEVKNLMSLLAKGLYQVSVNLKNLSAMELEDLLTMSPSGMCLGIVDLNLVYQPS